MSTWQEKFDELNAENGRQTADWAAGSRNHHQLRASMAAVTEFLRQYESAGEPDREREM